MKIICPKCGKSHRLPDDRLPDRTSAAKCKKCGIRMIITPHPDIQNGGISEQKEPAPNDFEDLLPTSDEEPEMANLFPSADELEARAKEQQDGNCADTADTDDEIKATFPELHGLSPERFVYSEIFSKRKGQGYRSRENTRTLKLIKAVHDILVTKILNKDEQVMRLTRGIAYYPFEIPYANGLLTMLSNYYAIVCTNQRLLFININSGINRPGRYIFQLPYDQITGVSRGVFLSSLILESKNGRRWNFTTIVRTQAKSLRDYILEQSKGQQPAGSPDDKPPRQLCPACYSPLPNGLSSCPFCSVSFKKPSEAMIRSLILPGLGSIYLTMLPLGIMEMVGYLGIWLLGVILMILKVPGGLVTAIAPVLVYHLMTGILARKTTGKGYILDK